MPSDGPFIHSNPSGNNAIAESLHLEIENRSINLSWLILIGWFDWRPSARIGQTGQSINVSTLLISAQCSGGVAETFADVVLIKMSRFKERSHCIGFRGMVCCVVMGKNNAMHGNHSPRAHCAKQYAVICNSRPGRGRSKRQQFFCSGDMVARMPNHVQIQKADNLSAAPMSAKLVVFLDFRIPCQEF
jgi:hypothetical protein